ncbi:PREDICTED: uncharacterized protein LOC107072169 [Polistes dominula]|uniref:Uncharacterized protein LOC107072169 n=1 Tax=Polistes dominula TaxID=743375 RepID=A0ABM1J4J1_POLDO|nr:PREDICTED: uncharacterized protein LOC107072169 [Polistes dominula]
MNELEENVPNVIDGDKRSVLESKDMHESFVEPMDRIDDFDDDVKIRLGRGLKTIDDNYFKNNTINNYTNQIQSIDEEHFTTTMKTINISTKYEIILHSSSASSSSSLDNSNTMRKKETENEDTHRKKLAMFLTADNMEDESQMDLALHGELAGKIVENIFEQVQRNEALKVALGPGLSKKNQHQDEIVTDKIYHHRDLDENYIKHTEKTMKKIMELLGRLVLDEVQSKTCATLPPDMQQFLEWILQINGDKDLHIQTSSLLPLTTHEQETTEHPVDDDKIISTKIPDEDIDKDLNEFQKKIRILKNLINEYNALSAKEKIKVQTVHDYLMRQLNLLLNYIKIKEKSNKNATSLVSRTAGVHGHNSGFIVRYQGESPKLKFDNNLTLIKDPNVSEYWKLNNTSFSLDIERNKRNRPIRSYYDNYVKSKKKRKKRKKRQRKRRRRRNEINDDKRRDDTPEYRKLARRAAAMIREKRDDNLDDEWNQFDFKYEQPKIYKSLNIINEPIEKIRNERSIDLQSKKKKRTTLETNNITITNFVNNHFDDLPVKGKNLAEDEMILLNKREAWKKENERQLEEVAFGKKLCFVLG